MDNPPCIDDFAIDLLAHWIAGFPFSCLITRGYGSTLKELRGCPGNCGWSVHPLTPVVVPHNNVLLSTWSIHSGYPWIFCDGCLPERPLKSHAHTSTYAKMFIMYWISARSMHTPKCMRRCAENLAFQGAIFPMRRGSHESFVALTDAHDRLMTLLEDDVTAEQDERAKVPPDRGGSWCVEVIHARWYPILRKVGQPNSNSWCLL